MSERQTAVPAELRALSNDAHVTVRRDGAPDGDRSSTRSGISGRWGSCGRIDDFRCMILTSFLCEFEGYPPGGDLGWKCNGCNDIADVCTAKILQPLDL